MRKLISTCGLVLLFAISLAAQSTRLWVLQASGELVQHDPATFAPKKTVKVPPEAVTSPQNLAVNALGQVLFVPSVSLPLAEGDLAAERAVWFWDGQAATTFRGREVARTTSTTGSNLAITESVSVPFLATDGRHLYWFSNQARRLQRDGVDLSTPRQHGQPG